MSRSMPRRSSSHGTTLGDVLTALARDPAWLVRRWNWKSALLSSVSRGVVFFAANLTAGPRAATAAFVTELWFRMLTSGFYGALTESMRDVEPARDGIVAGMVLLPLVSHSLEFAVHSLRGTPELGRSLSLSVAFTMLSTAFNVYAMRRGAFVVGSGAQPLHRDLAQVPRLAVEFARAILCAIARAFRARTGLA